MTPEQWEIWEAIVDQCADGRWRTNSVNVGTRKRREVILAINRMIKESRQHIIGTVISDRQHIGGTTVIEIK